MIVSSWIVIDGVVSLAGFAVKARQFRCSECGRRGHNRRTCPERAP